MGAPTNWILLKPGGEKRVKHPFPRSWTRTWAPALSIVWGYPQGSLMLFGTSSKGLRLEGESIVCTKHPFTSMGNILWWWQLGGSQAGHCTLSGRSVYSRPPSGPAPNVFSPYPLAWTRFSGCLGGALRQPDASLVLPQP